MLAGKLTAVLASLLVNASRGDNQQERFDACQKSGSEKLCENSFGTENAVNFDEDFDAKELSVWLKSQLKNVNAFCPDDDVASTAASFDSDISFRVVSSARDCEEGEISGWDGSVGSRDGMPKGPGKLGPIKRGPVDNKNHKFISDKPHIPKKCLELCQGVSAFVGSLSNGLPKGPGKTHLSRDGSTLVGKLVDGFHEGRTVMLDRDGRVRFVGVFRRGRPHGPGWVVMKGIDAKEEPSYLHLVFDQGEILTEKVLWISPGAKTFVLGSLANGTLLTNPAQVEPTRMGETSCVKAINLNSVNVLKRHNPIRLPTLIKTLPEVGSLLMRSSRTLMFNRVAKTGSQAMAELLVQLEAKTGVRANVVLAGGGRVEELRQPPEKVAEFVREVDAVAATRPAAWVRHYNFVDFERYGADWAPVYVNMVRDPIERIVSWFYYWRAAWNVVERKLAFPHEPLPDPEMLRKDLDTCVGEGDAECVFEQGADATRFPDHRSQVMAFCGHEQFCAKFNSPKALARAKENVERFYSVVGVLESMNKTLVVLEHDLPEFFAGATTVYNSNQMVKKRKNGNAFKLPVKKETMEKLRANFTREIEFYEFVRQRLDRRYDEISME